MKMVTHVLFRLRKNIVECVAVLFKLNGENRQTTMTKKIMLKKTNSLG